MHKLVKLNLGCGEKRMPGYINVDKYGDPDVVHDLETFPWPFDDNTVIEVRLSHVLEHIGETTSIYLKIIKELYRICVANAEIYIAVPDPRHDDFINDPTHVRIVTPDGMLLFSKAKNREWIKDGFGNSPLGLYLDVDFEIKDLYYMYDPFWVEKLQNGQITESQMHEVIMSFNNVIKEVRMTLRVIK